MPPVAGHDRELHRHIKGVRHDEVHIGDQEGLRENSCLPSHVYKILLHVLVVNEDALSGRNSKALALAGRVADRPLVAAYTMSFFIEKIAFRIGLSGIALHKGRVIPVGHEADVLGVAFLRIDELMLFCNLPRLFLRHAAEGKDGVGKLVLGHGVEDIGLVLGRIQPPLQKPPAPALVVLDPGIVAGHHIVKSLVVGAFPQGCKLEVAVALNAGIGRAPGLVSGDEGLYDPVGKLGRQVQNLILHPQLDGDIGGVIDVLVRAAGLRLLLHRGVANIIELHRRAHAGVAPLQHQHRRHRRIHTPAHGYKRRLTHSLPASHWRTFAPNSLMRPKHSVNLTPAVRTSSCPRVHYMHIRSPAAASSSPLR